MTPGQIAFQAWAEAHGNPASFPAWEQIPDVVKQKWEAVAEAVLMRVDTP